MASVEIRNVTKIYDNKARAIDKASLVINDGEFVVLVGPSGCGKSTLLRMIAGLEEISEGEISIGETVVNNIPVKDRNIAMVFQNYALYPHMTVYDNMAFGLKLRKFNKKDIEERVVEAAKILDLTEYLKRKPKQLSGGQRQRVAVGRAIVRKPAVFLFDEPLSNLDAKLRVQMRLEISKLHKNLGVTMIYVTHDQVEAMTMGQRIVVLNNGCIQQYDTPLNVYKNPLNKFVAGFIGSPAMNFLAGEVLKNGGLYVFKSNEIKWDLDKDISQKVEAARCREINMGIRPENLFIQTKDTAHFPSIEAGVDLIELMGNEMFVYLYAGETRLTMRCSPDININTGDNLKLSFNPKNVHFFNAETGNII